MTLAFTEAEIEKIRTTGFVHPVTKQTFFILGELEYQIAKEALQREKEIKAIQAGLDDVKVDRVRSLEESSADMLARHE